MIIERQKSISGFYVAGINYKKTDSRTRGLFAVNQQQYEKIIKQAPSFHLKEFFILSTCNRTEIFGFAEDTSSLIDALCTQTTGTKETFLQLCYVKKGMEAINHLFEVGAGLESQILGDYEIICQLKTAVKFAKENGVVGCFLERLINSVLQSTKEIKNQTVLSSGTVSVSFAAVQYIRNNVCQSSEKNILLVGTGKIGRNTCKNLVDYIGAKNITLVNRTAGKAADLAKELGLYSASLNELPELIDKADIILVASNSNEPTILANHLKGKGSKLVIDLSIPNNVEKAAGFLPNITLLNVDELSKMKDETLQKRMEEVPKAKTIIAEYIKEFIEWSEMRKNVPYIKAAKQKLHDMQKSELYQSMYEHYTSNVSKSTEQNSIEKVIKNMAIKMRQQNQPGCCYIEAINDFITTHSN